MVQNLMLHKMHRCIFSGPILELGKLRQDIYLPSSQEWGLSNATHHCGTVKVIGRVLVIPSRGLLCVSPSGCWLLGPLGKGAREALEEGAWMGFG